MPTILQNGPLINNALTRTNSLCKQQYVIYYSED